MTPAQPTESDKAAESSDGGGSSIWFQVGLALGSGMAGVVLIRFFDLWRERNRERRDLLAACKLVEYELASMLTMLAMFSDGTLSASSVVLDDAAYRSVQFVLTRGLPADLADRIASDYALLPLTRVNVQRVVSEGLSQPVAKNLQHVLDEFSDGVRRLRVFRESGRDPGRASPPA